MKLYRRAFRRLTKSLVLEVVAVAAILSLMTVQLWQGARADGVTFDEPIHLLSGYTILTDHHILIDPEHPPLIKAIAALPLLWIQPNVPPSAQDIPANQSTLEANTYTQANSWGWKMLFSSGNDPYQLLWAGRAMMIGLTIVAAGLLWLWSRQLFGRTAGLATLILFSLDPTVLAHGHYINTDSGAALMWVASLVSVWQFLTKRSRKWLVLSGVVIGLSLLSKFSLVVLLGIVPLLMVAWLVYHRHDMDSIDLKWPLLMEVTNRLGKKWMWLTGQRKLWFNYAVATALMLGLAVSLIWLCYGLLWLLNPGQNPLWALTSSAVSPIWGWLPGMYGKGIKVIGGDRSGYLLGECYKGSRWDFFPILTFFKMPLGSLALSLGGAISLGLTFGHRVALNKWPFVVWFLGIPLLVYLSLSMFAGVNIGIRHILPAYTLLFMMAGYAASRLWHLKRGAWQGMVGKGLVITLISLTAWSSLSASPYYLSYYNELSGEPHNRPWVSDDSSTDWGEGALALAKFVEENGVEQIGFNNFVGWNEVSYLKVPVVGVKAGDHDYKGWLAISRSSVVYQYCRMGNAWGWLIDNYDPVAIVGGSINIYHID